MPKPHKRAQASETRTPESKSLVSTTLTAEPASKLLWQPREQMDSRVVP